jgi:hypothetical protein
MSYWIFLVGVVLGFGFGAASALYAVNRSSVPTLSLKGWFCMCGIFNGEEKEIQHMCRTCARSREWALKNQPQNLTRIAYLGDGR